MPTYAVTGATGQLAAHAFDALLDRGVVPGDVVAVVRDTGKAASLRDRGFAVRLGDYDRPETLEPALDGVDRLLFVSGSEPGKRVPQHTNLVRAAVAAGVGRVAYTSLIHADTTELLLAPEHKATEAVLRESGLPWTFLRNGWYVENYTRALADDVERGSIVGATHGRLVSLAPRADYARAAVAALTNDGHEGAVYELGGPGVSLTGFAAAVSEVTGRTLTYRDLATTQELVAALTGAGLDEGTAGFVAAIDEGIARGDLDVPDTDLVALLGRPVTPLADVLRDEAAAAGLLPA